MPNRTLPPSVAALAHQRALQSAAGATALAVVLAACGGGGSSRALPATVATGGSGAGTPTAAPAGAARTPATVALRIPAKRVAKGVGRNARYVSPSTQGIAISAVSSGGTLPATPQFTAAIGSPYCTAQTDGSQLCSFPISAPIGNDNIDVALYDQPPTAKGAVQGNVLSHVLAPETIAVNAMNSLTLTLGGVVAAAGFSGGAWTSAGGVVRYTLSVVAYDAQGNVIAGSDPYDSAVTLGIAGDGASHLSFVTGGTLHSPADNTVILQWDNVSFTTAALTVTVGSQTASTALQVPAPKQFASVPVTIPASSRGDLALGLDFNSPDDYAGSVVVPAGSTSDNEATLGGFFVPAETAASAGDVMTAVLPDNSVAAAYAAYLYWGYTSGNAVEVDVASTASGYIQLTTSPLQPSTAQTFYTDLCQLVDAHADASGNLSLIGQNGCGVTAGSAVGLLSTQRHGVARRRAPSATRRFSGRRGLRSIAGTVALETFTQPLAFSALGLAPAHAINSSTLLTTATGFTTDGTGRFYVANDTGSGGEIDVFETTSTNGDSPDGTIRLNIVDTNTHVASVAVNATGRIAVLLVTTSNGVTTGATIEILNGYPSVTSASSPLATWSVDPGTVASPTRIAFDRYNNLWVLGGQQLAAYPPLPITISSGYTASFASNAIVSLQSSASSIAAFPSPIPASSPVLQPTPTPGPSTSSLP